MTEAAMDNDTDTGALLPVTQAARKAAEEHYPPHLWKEAAIADLAQAFAKFERDSIARQQRADHGAATPCPSCGAPCEVGETAATEVWVNDDFGNPHLETRLGLKRYRHQSGRTGAGERETIRTALYEGLEWFGTLPEPEGDVPSRYHRWDDLGELADRIIIALKGASQ